MSYSALGDDAQVVVLHAEDLAGLVLEHQPPQLVEVATMSWPARA